MNFLNRDMILPFATALGAFGGFPAPPPQFMKLAQFPLFRFFTLFVLVWQGGAGQDANTAFVTAAIVFAISYFLNNMAAAPVEEGYGY